jgi:hypothetical protein
MEELATLHASAGERSPRIARFYILYTNAFVGSSSRLISCRQMDEMKKDRIYVTPFRYVPTAYIYIRCHLGAKHMKIESGVENILLR